jgi:hypothetical protein
MILIEIYTIASESITFFKLNVLNQMASDGI